MFWSFFFWLTLLFSHLSHLSPVPAEHSSSPLLVHNQCLSLSVLLCSFFLIVGSFSLLLFTRCPTLLSSYHSLPAFLLSPLLASHLWLIADSSLTGRLMPVFIPHIPAESHLLYSLPSAHSSPAPRQLPYLLQWKFRSGFFVLLEPSLCAIAFSGLAALFFLVLMLVVLVHDRDRLSFYSSL